MYGLISQLVTFPEKRDELLQILAAGTKDMPGCLSYVIAEDGSRDDAVWVTEVWMDRESHAASRNLPAVQEALTKGRPLIVGMGTRTATHPIAGI
jgi:quinol monooxygenase YgiN